MDGFLRLQAGPGGVISRVPRHDHRADSAFFAQIQTDIDTLSLFHASQHREGITGPQSPAKRTFVALHFILKYKSDSYL